MRYILVFLCLVGCAGGSQQQSNSAPVPACLNSKFIQDTNNGSSHTIYDSSCIYSYTHNSPCSQSGTYTDTGIGSTSGKVHIKLVTDSCGPNAGKTVSCDYSLDSFGQPLVVNCVVN